MASLMRKKIYNFEILILIVSAMEISEIYVNFPVKNVEKTRAFWVKLGFKINEQFSNDQGICVIFKENAIYAMFLAHDFFQTFTNRPVATSATTQTLNAIGVESTEKVDELIEIAVANGGTLYHEARDHGWMYQRPFADPDGHQWEVMFADLSKLPVE